MDTTIVIHHPRLRDGCIHRSTGRLPSNTRRVPVRPQPDVRPGCLALNCECTVENSDCRIWTSGALRKGDNWERPVNGTSPSLRLLHSSPDASVEDGALLSSDPSEPHCACCTQRATEVRSTPDGSTARLPLMNAFRPARMQRIHVGRRRVMTPALGLHREGVAHPDSRVRRPTRWC